MTAEKRDQKKPSWIVVTAVAGGVLALVVLRLTSPSTPPPAPEEEYTFQPEPRRPPINLQQSSGGLSSRSAAAPVPSPQTANCNTLQDFANYEYEKRFRDGKVSELMVFSGFEQQEVSVSKTDTLNCSGGSFTRRGKNGSLTCDNVILSYDSRSNTLTYNLQYVYVARGLQPQCSDER
jgi:hypothetical protein